jgi:N-acetylmuramoyl-L-alanine amidase
VKQALYGTHKILYAQSAYRNGFTSNTIEGNKLNSEEGQDEIAKQLQML